MIHAGAYTPKSAESIDITENYLSLANIKYLLNHLPNLPKKVIFLSSVAVYKNFSTGDYYNDDDMITEDTVPDPENPYGLMKYCGELYIKDWADRTGVKCDILRLSSIYGAGDSRRQMINVMIERAVKGQMFTLYANPYMIRNQLFVDDCCKFIMASAEKTEEMGIINLASSMNYTLEDIVKGIIEVTGTEVSFQISPAGAVGRNMRISARKREKYLGVEDYTLIDGIREIYEWKKKLYCKNMQT